MKKVSLAVLVIMMMGLSLYAESKVVVPWSVITGAVSAYSGGKVPTAYDKIVGDGSTIYAEVRQSSPSYTWFVKITDAGKSTMAASVVGEFAGNPVSGATLGVAGNNLILAAGGTYDAIWKVNKNGGAVTEYVSKAAIAAQTGGADLTTGFGTTDPYGEVVVYETVVDQLIRTNGAGQAQILLSNAQLVAAMGTAGLQGQMAYDSSSNLFLCNTDSDSIWKFDGTNLTQVISKAQAIAVTGDTAFGVNAQVYNPTDGKMYIQDLTSRNILSYDPANPAGSLKLFMTKQQLIDSPLGTSTLAYFAIADGKLVTSAYNAGSLAICTVPEPTTMGMLMLGGLGLLKSRRR